MTAPERRPFPAPPSPAPPFTAAEYHARLEGLRDIMAGRDVAGALLTSAAAVTYYTGHVPLPGTRVGCLVTEERCILIVPAEEGDRPAARAACEGVFYATERRDTYWQTVASLAPGGRFGIEADHMTLADMEALVAAAGERPLPDLAPDIAAQRLIKSDAEIAHLRAAARVADLGEAAMRNAIRTGAREIDVALAGRDAMEIEVARSYPGFELGGAQAALRSGAATASATAPAGGRRLRAGDLLTLKVVPALAGYRPALVRTLHLGPPDAETRRVWKAAAGAHTLCLSLARPGATGAAIAAELSRFLEEEGVTALARPPHVTLAGSPDPFAGLPLLAEPGVTLEAGMVVAIGPCLIMPEGQPGAGGYRGLDHALVTTEGGRPLSPAPYGPPGNTISGV